MRRDPLIGHLPGAATSCSPVLSSASSGPGRLRARTNRITRPTDEARPDSCRRAEWRSHPEVSDQRSARIDRSEEESPRVRLG